VALCNQVWICVGMVNMLVNMALSQVCLTGGGAISRQCVAPARYTLLCKTSSQHLSALNSDMSSLGCGMVSQLADHPPPLLRHNYTVKNNMACSWGGGTPPTAMVSLDKLQPTLLQHQRTWNGANPSSAAYLRPALRESSTPSPKP
jgi:hypothetical protein